MLIIDGWLKGAKIIKSPHYDLRPDNETISLLVIHNISLPPENFDACYVEEFFTGRLNPAIDPYFKQIASLKVSSHLYIRRDGQLIQFVSFAHRAWHAGCSEFNGKSNCNNYSIGIELEGTDDIEYTDKQYAVLTRVTRSLQKQYPHIKKQHIKGHCEIAPERKTDPGESFDWQRYLKTLV